MFSLGSRLSLYLIYLFLLFPLFSSWAADPEDLPPIPSFATVLQSALTTSLEAKRGILLQEEAGLERSLLDYERYPKAGLSAVLTEKQTKKAGVTTPSDGRTVGLDITHDLYDFGRSGAKKSLAESEMQVREMDLQEVNETLLWKVARSYFKLVSTGRLLSISNENKSVSQSRLAVVEEHYRKGLRPLNDLVAARADFGETQLAYDRARALLLVEVRKVFQLMGAPFPSSYSNSNSNFNPGSDSSFQSWRSPEVWEEILKSWKQSSLSAAQRKRDIQIEGLGASQKILSTSKAPNLGIRLSGEQNNKKEIITSGQLELTWDIPWPGQYKEEREKIENRRKVLQTEEALELRDREYAREGALHRFALEKSLWAMVERQLELRTHQYHLTKSRYQTGKTGPLELSNSELELGRVRLEKARIGNALTEAVLDLAESYRIRDLEIIFKNEK